MTADDSSAYGAWQRVHDELARAAAGTGTLMWLVLDGIAVAGIAGSDMARLRKVLVHGRPPARSRTTDAAAILFAATRTGYVLAVGNPQRRALVVEQLSGLADDIDALAEAVELARESRAGLESSLIRELVTATRDSATLGPWLASFGFNPGLRVRTLAALAVSADHGRIPHALRDLGARYPGPCVVGVHDEVAYALLVVGEATGGGPDAFAEDLETMLEVFTHRYGSAFPVGVSTTLMTGPGDLAQSLISARALAQREQRADTARSVADDALPATLAGELLAASGDRAQRLVATLLNPIIDYDSRNDSDYLKTLRSFLLHDGAVRATAADLGIHINTLRYRIDRIERLTVHGLGRTADRADFYLALYLYERPLRSDHQGSAGTGSNPAIT